MKICWLKTAVEKYNIIVKIIWNFDEKEFIIGISDMSRQIMTKEELKSEKLIDVFEDGNRNLMFFLAIISALREKTFPVLIYQID